MPEIMSRIIDTRYRFYFSLREKAAFKNNKNGKYFYQFPSNIFILEKGILDIYNYIMQIENEFRYNDHLTTKERRSLAERIYNFFEARPRHKSVVVMYRADNLK